MKKRNILLQPANAGSKIAAIVLTAFLLALGVGCPFNHPAGIKSTVAKRITEIRVSEDDESWYCTIKGVGPLTFTAANQVDPAGLLLYFPATALDAGRTVYLPPDNEFFSAIEADEVSDGDLKTARVSIVLQVERPYALSPDADGVRVSFPKTTHGRTDSDDAGNREPGENTTGPAEKDTAVATVLEAVTATSLKNHIIVTVNADGTIGDYQSFVIENPARIVFDIYNLKSPHENEQIIPVASRWVKQIRYFAYPDKIRLVLDTEPEFLSQYFSFATASGLLIYVGRMPEPLAERD